MKPRANWRKTRNPIFKNATWRKLKNEMNGCELFLREIVGQAFYKSYNLNGKLKVPELSQKKLHLLN